MSDIANIPGSPASSGAYRVAGWEHLGRVLVLGLGKSGKSVARYCAGLIGSRVDSLFIAAGAENDDSRAFVESLAGEGVSYAFGDDALEGERGHFDVCIASPGIPYWHELYQRGLQVSDELMSEVEFSWRESDPASTWVAITGTNGKTTTTSLAAHVLKECGFAAAPVGNIGDVCLDAVAAGKTDVYVCEVSSYQLASTIDFAPDVAVLLNITPDHIHWHKTLEAYRDAKFRLLDNVARRGLAPAGLSEAATSEGGAVSEDCLSERSERVPQDRAPGKRASGSFSARSGALQCAPVTIPELSLRPNEEREPQSAPQAPARGAQPQLTAILDATNDVVRKKVRELKAMTREERGFDYVPMGTADGIRGDMRAKCGAENATFVDEDERLHVALRGSEHVLLPVSDLQIKGDHNTSNALAAASVAVALGADDGAICRSLASFAPLEHRVEPCGTVRGIECYNDSKGTNTDATVKALSSFPGKRVIVLLGGDDKGTDLSDLIAATHANAYAAVCYGAGGPRFASSFAAAAGEAPAGFSVIEAANMEAALNEALDIAEAGDVLLLSPACASFDEFKSFEERGRVFKQLVADHRARRGA